MRCKDEEWHAMQGAGHAYQDGRVHEVPDARGVPPPALGPPKGLSAVAKPRFLHGRFAVYLKPLDHPANVQENYNQAGEEAIQQAQWADGQSLEDLLEMVGNWNPVDLANQLVYINPGLDFRDLPHLPALGPLKAILRVLTISSLFLEGMR